MTMQTLFTQVGVVSDSIALQKAEDLGMEVTGQY